MLRRRIQRTAAEGYVIESDRDGRFVVTDAWTDSTREAFLAAGPERLELTLNYARGFRERSLEFLVGLPVHRLMVLSRTLRDVSPIYSLASTLEALSVEAAERVSLELDRLPRLRSVFADWSYLAKSIEAATELRTFRTMGYEPRDLMPLSNSKSLQQIVLKMAPGLESLDGISQFVQLEEVWIQGARRLHDTSDLGSVGPRLMSLQLEACPGIESLDDLRGLVGLRLLEVADCGPIDSLRPIESMAALEQFYGWGTTRVTDDDLSPLTRLPRLLEVRVRDRATYHPRLGEFVDTKTFKVKRPTG